MTEKYKILCVGDSTSLPGHTNSYEDTWFFKLKHNFTDCDFISVFRRSITTDILVTEGGGDIVDKFPMGADCLEFYNPHIVILQLGIVDCAPRLLNKVDKLILRFLPYRLKDMYIKNLKKIKKRKSSNTIVTAEKFLFNIKSYIERCLLREVKTLILIAIPFPDDRMINKNPQIVTNINIYNKILYDFSERHNFIKVINPLDSRRYNENIFEDGYHPNPFGNEIVYQKIKFVMSNYVKSHD